MNAGAYESEIESKVLRCATVDRCGNTLIRDRAQMGFGYRTSALMSNGEIVTDIFLRLCAGEAEAIRERMERTLSRRKASQPLDFPSAGSVFKRPSHDYAGRLIECCGLKGAREGGAQVSEKHAGFIINTGNATADDVMRLIDMIQNKVYIQTGVRLETEIKFIA